MIWCKKYIRLLTVVKMKLLLDITAASFTTEGEESDSKSIISYCSQKFLHMLRALFNNVVILLNCYVSTLCFKFHRVNRTIIMNFTSSLNSLHSAESKKFRLRLLNNYSLQRCLLITIMIWIFPFVSSSSSSSTHEINHSPNIIKTKYGLLRGVILKHEPLIEGYLGIPYGKF